jgi:uncharacterized protein YbjT (DUF2867 family)
MSDESSVVDPKPIHRVLLTGATGFVGRYVLRELVQKGFTPVCLVRSPSRLTAALGDIDRERVAVVQGGLSDAGALRTAAEMSDAVIHLVGIILENRLSGQTFDRVHRRGTEAVVNATRQAGISRYVHMSALGSRSDAKAPYHRSKYAADCCVRTSGLDWTIFQPSIIHGFDGEFMELMHAFACGWIPPVMPYFGTGKSRLQPVFVEDVARVFVGALNRCDTIGQTYALGGPDTYSWKELYATCARCMPKAKTWKPMVSQPVPIAKLLAATVMKTPLVPRRFKFNTGQVQMSQEDSVCPIEPVETAFGIKLRGFEQELIRYADMIR